MSVSFKEYNEFYDEIVNKIRENIVNNLPSTTKDKIDKYNTIKRRFDYFIKLRKDVFECKARLFTIFNRNGWKSCFGDKRCGVKNKYFSRDIPSIIIDQWMVGNANCSVYICRDTILNEYGLLKRFWWKLRRSLSEKFGLMEDMRFCFLLFKYIESKAYKEDVDEVKGLVRSSRKELEKKFDDFLAFPSGTTNNDIYSFVKYGSELFELVDKLDSDFNKEISKEIEKLVEMKKELDELEGKNAG